MNLSAKSVLSIATLLTSLVALAQATANQSVVFRLGNFDGSSTEFASGSPERPVRYVMGQSDVSKDWYQTQPAILAAPGDLKTAEPAAAPRAIVFSLQSKASGYTLHLSLLIESASVPALLVDVNGKHGLFYLHPELDYRNGDQGDSFYPAYSHADVEVPIPSGFLQQGENTITLQAIEEAEQKVPEAGLTYDAIELDRGTGISHAASSLAEIRPTVFFAREDGALHEIVDAFIRYDRPMNQGDIAELTIGGKKYEKPLTANHDFGEEKLEFHVAEFAAGTQARLTWNATGHTEHLAKSIDPKKKWTVFLVPHIHVDVGYSDYQAKVAAIQARSIDEAMDMTAKHPDYRFSLDGEWDLEQT